MDRQVSFDAEVAATRRLGPAPKAELGWWALGGAVAVASAALAQGPAAIGSALLGVVLVVIARIDLSRLVVYDALSLPLIPAGLLWAWLAEPGSAAPHAAAAVAAPAAVWAVSAAYRRLRRREGLGGGDLRLLAVAGAWVGPAGIPTVLLLASALGILTAFTLVSLGRAGWGSRIPFAPALCAATWLVVVLPETWT